MVWIPKEPKYKPKPPKPNNIPTNTPTDTPMTNQEAIEKLRLMKFKYLIKRGSGFDTALDMGIEALKEHKSDGNWIDENDSNYAHCSRCGYQIDTHIERGYLNYCPNCGKYMLGGESK